MLAKAEQCSKDQPLAQARLGDMGMGSGDYVAAYQAYQIALLREPANVHCRLRAAQMLMLFNRREQTKSLLDQLVVEQSYLPALVALAQLEETLGNETRAIALYLQILKHTPDNIVANNNLWDAAHDVANYWNAAQHL